MLADALYRVFFDITLGGWFLSLPRLSAFSPSQIFCPFLESHVISTSRHGTLFDEH
jgi:hypothetical protein